MKNKLLQRAEALVKKPFAGWGAKRPEQTADRPEQETEEEYEENETVPANVLTGITPVVLSQGHLDVPEGTIEIGHRALEGRKDLISVSVPASVKSIGVRAFAECENLEQVVFHEGLERIEQNVFTGCSRLRSVVIPDSVTELTGWAFFHSGLTEPVRNVSGDKLYFCPEAAAGTEYAVPEGVRQIASRAFIELASLRRIRFPKTLESVCPLAFFECGLESAVIPAGVKMLGESVFYNCRELKSISLEGENDVVRSASAVFHAQGKTFLARVRCALPEGDPYWREPEFQALAQACGTGSAGAMEEMAGFFERKSQAAPETPFYIYAANFWRYRAYEHGSQTQRAWLEDWIEKNPGGRLPSVCLAEDLEGFADGLSLNALGFLFFDPDRDYNLNGTDSAGVVEAASYESEDGPDEDGFGREIYYDWWYLDDNLLPVPGADCLHSYSMIDRRISTVTRRFQKCHDIAAAAIRERRKAASGKGEAD